MATTPASNHAAAPPHRRFRLTGRSAALDPRVDAARRDVADARLADQIFAPHYAVPLSRYARTTVPIRAELNASAPVLSELLAGDCFDVIEVGEASCWGVSASCGTVGYVDKAALVDVAPAAAPESSTTLQAAAREMVGAPFQQGGRSPAGTDAAGLVHYCLARVGVTVPRFADLQLTAGETVDGSPQPGDIVFTDDQPALLIEADTVIAQHGIEPAALIPLQDLGAITAVRRP